MPHIETLIKTQRIMCMKKYLDSHYSTWKIFLDSYLADFGGSFLIKCNYDVRFPPKTLPKFYKECLSEWADYKKSPVVTLPDVLKEIVWNNKFMCINGKPLFRNKVLKKGFLTVRDILSDEGKLKSWSALQSKHLTGAEYFVLMSVFDAIPLEWKTLLKDMPSNPPRNNECRDNTFPTSSKEVYWDPISKIEKSPVSKSKYEQLFPTHDLPWKDIYLLPRSATLDSRMQTKPSTEWALSIHLRVPFVKYQTNPWSIYLYTVQHQAFFLWLSVAKWLKSFFTKIDVLTSTDIMFGFFKKDMPLLNNIILLGKQVIYHS